MTERIGRYEIVEAGVETTPAENRERPVDAVWGRRWTLRYEGTSYPITFEADLALLEALDKGAVTNEVRRVFDSNGRSKVEDYSQRDPTELPRRVVLKPTKLVEFPRAA